MKKIIAVIFTAVLALCPLVNAQSPPNFGALESLIVEEMEATHTPGAAVVVVEGDRVLFQKAFGVDSVETRQPVTTDTMFRLGSTTKMFVAAAAVALAEAGKLKLDQPIGEYVPELHPSLKRLTLHQLLSHTAGLKDDAPMNGPLDEAALAQRVRGWNESAFFTEPGRIMSYANPGYVLAGYVLERVAGKPFADVIGDFVLKPLGMEHSTFRPTTAMTYPLALGHDPTRDAAAVIRPFAEHAGNWPPGSLFTNVQEYSRFLSALVNNPKFVFQTIATPKAPVVALDRQYGYGLVAMTERGIRIVEHSGARSGYGSVVWTAPDRHIAVVILTNRTGAIFFKSARKAVELLTPDATSEAPESRQIELPMDASEIAQYAGLYVNSETIRAELISQGGELRLKFAGRSFPVHKIGLAMFSAPGSGQLEQFRLVPGPDGKSEYLAVEYWALRRLN